MLQERQQIKMVKTIVSPSILSANPLSLLEDIKKIEKAGADWHHIDVMDGHFVSNLTFGLPLIRALKKQTTLPLDVHIMVSNPDEVASQYVKAGADMLTFHLEAAKNPLSIIQIVKKLGGKIGIAINPETSVVELKPYLNFVDMILVMSVNPGKGGQQFIKATYNKLDALQQLIALEPIDKPCIKISVDGGVNALNSKILHTKGVDVLVAGSFVYKSLEPEKSIQALKR